MSLGPEAPPIAGQALPEAALLFAVVVGICVGLLGPDGPVLEALRFLEMRLLWFWSLPIP